MFKKYGNIEKSENKVFKTIKKYILRFIRRFYQPELDYIEKVVEKWINSFVIGIIDILLNGFVLWLSFIGILRIYSFFVHQDFRLTDIFYYGVVLWSISHWYQFFRIGYKRGAKK